jgi:2-polyprenyl-6-methoxyphenol hydroxylase-like FAD-dependent oxidoreductase
MKKPYHIVIIGGGAAGTAAARLVFNDPIMRPND